MSYTIEDSKFVIFGNGHDGTSIDSGEGRNEPEIHSILTPTHGAFDTTGTYVYLTDGNKYVRKFQVSPWQEIATSLPRGNLFHPTNVENNIGIIFHHNASDITVFNLDTEEIIKTFSGTGGFAYVADCMMIDDDIYLIRKSSGKISTAMRHINIAYETDVLSNVYGAVSGFVDDDTIYCYRAGTWWSDPTYANGYALDFTSQWQGTYSTSADYPVNMGGLCANGHLYLPTLKDGKWQIGVYDGNSVPTFEPVPNPIRTYGDFGQRATLVISGKDSFFDCYNNGRTKAVFATNIGTYFTDFLNRLSKITDDNSQPLAMSEHHFVAPYGINQVIVYKV